MEPNPFIPIREIKINGVKIQEFCIAGECVVFVDERKTSRPYMEAVRHVVAYFKKQKAEQNEVRNS